MTRPSHRKLISLACWLALVALALMVWSLFDPRPVPVIGAMSVGQVFGTLSLAAFLYVVVRDVRPALVQVLEKEIPPSLPPPRGTGRRG
jgi:hypothetical protein